MKVGLSFVVFFAAAVVRSEYLELDGQHWLVLDGVMTRLQPKVIDEPVVEEEHVYHVKDYFAEEHGHQGHKISPHELNEEELTGGHDAPAPAKTGLAAPAKELIGGYDAPAPAKTGLAAPAKELTGGYDAPAPAKTGLSAPVQAGMSAPAKEAGLSAPAKEAIKEGQKELAGGHHAPVPAQSGLAAPAPPAKRRVVTRVRSSSNRVKHVENEDKEEHHDVLEIDDSQWITIDGVLTRLHRKSQTDDVSDERTYHDEDHFAKEHGHQGLKIMDHELTNEELTGGYEAPKISFYGMWTGETLGLKAPARSKAPRGYSARRRLVGSNKFKQAL